MTIPEDRYISVGDTRVRYWREGDADSTVLLVHGIGRFIEDWLLTIPALSEHHRVFAVDLVGHGRSDKPDAPYTPSYYADFLRSFLSAVGVERPALVGNSFGGGLCMQTAFSHPQACRKMILLAPAGFGRRVILPLRLLTIPGLGEIMTRPREYDSRNVLQGLVHRVEGVPEGIREYLAARQGEMAALPGAQKAFLRTARRNMTICGVKRRLTRRLRQIGPSILAPSLIIWGERDRVISVDQAQVGIQTLPNATLEVLPECGHLPQLEHPDRVNELTLKVLSG